MLRVASDGLVGAPPLLTRPSDLNQLSVNAGVGSRPDARRSLKLSTALSARDPNDKKSPP
jgi:hypothetical protein